MLSIARQETWAEAAKSLLPFILDPKQWVYLPEVSKGRSPRPGLDPRFQRVVGPIQVCASIDVTDKLQGFLRVGFFGPDLTPPKASDHLTEFLKHHIPLWKNQEWQCEIDSRKWIHFIRRYAAENLRA